jgi:glycerol-3-phosphate dehydrogenase
MKIWVSGLLMVTLFWRLRRLTARHEYCESAIDFIARRSRLSFLGIDAARRALPRVIQLLAAEHKWDKSRQKEELQKAKDFLETFKSSKNAQFYDGKHN